MRTFARLLFLFLTALLPLQTAGAQEQLEVDGVLIKGIIDLENGESEQMAHIRESRSGKTFNIELIDGKLPKALEEIKAGERVIIRGINKGEQQLSFKSVEENQQGPRAMQDLSFLPRVHGPGARTVLAVMVDFTDDQAICETTEHLNTMLFDKAEEKSLVNWVSKTSQEKYSISGEVVRVQIDVDGSASSCSFNTWGDKADAALRAKGINPDDYSHQQYAIPRSSKCGWGGVAYLGSNRSWVRACSTKIFAHELGHSFGMGHANSESKGAYGDYTDTMGRYFFELNAPHREQMGWTPNEKIITASGEMTVKIAPLNTPASQTDLPQIIKVKRPGADDYAYISFRNNTGPWDSSLGASYFDHLSIHRYAPKSRDPHTYLMQTLSEGGSYTIQDGNTLVQNVSVTPEYIEVKISGATGEPCERKAPTLTLPSYPSSVEAGKSFGGTLKLTNNNNVYCSPETFKFQVASVSGITFSMASAEIKLASGSTYNSEFLVQTDYSLGAGDQELPIRGLNKEHTNFVAQDKFVFKTVLPTDKVDPDVKITAPLAGAQIEAMSDVSFKAHATDNVAVTKVEFLVNSTKVCEDTSYPFECQFKMIEGKDVQLMARAFDKAGNFKTHMVLVQGTPIVDKTAPTIKITSPGNGSEHYVGGLLKVEMSASDNVGVEKTRVYVNAIMKCEDTTAPYECDISVPQGETQLMARAYDKAGNFKSEIIKIVGKVGGTDTTPPSVQLDSPVNGAEFKASTMIKAGASASDDTGVVKVEFFVDDVRKCRLYSLPYTCEFAMPDAANAKVYAIAYDAAGNSSKSNVATIGSTLVVDTISPVVTINSPADNTNVAANSKVSLKIDAVDNIGVNRVAVYQFNYGSNYGFHKRCDLQAPPYECELLISEGPSRIFVYAWDKAGNIGREQISIKGVSNSVVDNESPKAKIVDPIMGQKFSTGEKVNISVEASDNIGVASVGLYYKSQRGHWKHICSKMAAPYECSFLMPDQNEVKILAFALDKAGNRVIALTTIGQKGADLERPVVKVTSHQNGDLIKALQSITLQIEATDDIGVERVLVYMRNDLDGGRHKKVCELASGPYKCQLQIKEGSNAIYVRAYDKAGNFGHQMMVINGNSTGEVDSTKPVTKLVTPSSGDSVKAGEVFTVRASASDNVSVTRMRLYVWHESTGYRVLCDTPKATEMSCPVKALKGEMRIMPRAYDASGNFHSVLHKVYGR